MCIYLRSKCPLEKKLNQDFSVVDNRDLIHSLQTPNPRGAKYPLEAWWPPCFCKPTNAGEKEMTAPNLLDVGARHGQGKRPHHPKPDAASAQAATNGSHHPRVLNPGPLSLGPGIETRHTNRSKKQPT
jgi:hypothetical protein